MGEPLTFSAISTGITTIIRIFEVTYQLQAVGEQTADLLETTQHVQLNIREARRLRRLKDSLLNAGERGWMDKVIEDTENAVRAVAQLIEPSRVDMQTERRIDFLTKAVWVFRDSPKVRDKFARLSVCHQSLNTVVACLYSRDVVVVAPVMEESRKDLPPPYDPQVGELFSWRRNNRRRKKDSASSKTDSALSLTLSSPTSSLASPEMSTVSCIPSADQGRDGPLVCESPGFGWATRSDSEDSPRPSGEPFCGSNFAGSTFSIMSYDSPAVTYSAPSDQGRDELQGCGSRAIGWSSPSFPGHDGLQVCEGSGASWGTQSYSEGRPGLTKEPVTPDDSRSSTGRRGSRRAWLAYQATRSDLYHNTS